MFCLLQGPGMRRPSRQRKIVEEFRDDGLQRIPVQRIATWRCGVGSFMGRLKVEGQLVRANSTSNFGAGPPRAEKRRLILFSSDTVIFPQSFSLEGNVFLEDEARADAVGDKRLW